MCLCWPDHKSDYNPPGHIQIRVSSTPVQRVVVVVVVIQLKLELKLVLTNNNIYCELTNTHMDSWH